MMESLPHAELSFARDRIRALLDYLERLASGDTQATFPISPEHDELDAIAFAMNRLVDQLGTARARTMEANFAKAFHSNPCAMTITRLSDGRFLDVNESFERQTGYARDEVIGRTVQEFGMWIDPDDLAALGKAMREGRVGSREVRFRTKSGALATSVFSADIIMFGGEQCVLAVGLDVTERKKAEIQAATLREELAHLGRVTMLDALAGSLAHEINQPLTAVMANAEAALRLIATQPLRLPELRETLKEILSDNRRAGDVLRHMNALLKKGESRHEPVEVNNIIGDVAKLIQGNAVGRQIVLDVDLASDLEPVLGDRIQIQQVVLNLLMNAFDAVQKRETADRRVRLRTSRRDQTVVVEVSDSGMGLSDEELSRIFKPFYTTKQDGIGLGLSICRAIAAAHGGALEASRHPGTGMTFSVSFPVWRARSEQTHPSTIERLQEQR
jgi:two-component system sensor kinase FixL